jgi:gamma-glutamylcyclotransferase (GGCT)/AIG2-like uncharacterized protein YtfP
MIVNFAYGTNMDRERMRLRCPGARAIGPGRLAGWRLTVSVDGYVSVARQAGACVHGVIWRLTARDLAALDAYESIASGLYRRRMLPVLVDGRKTPAQIYIGRSGAPGRPRPGHLPIVLAAAQSWNLPPAYVVELQRCSSPHVARMAEAGALR